MSTDNADSCEIEVVVLEITQRLCVVLLPRPIDHTLVGFKAPATITWKLVAPTPSGYFFADDGVTFIDPLDNFEGNSNQGTQYSWKNKYKKHTVTDDFKYAISIKHPGSRRTCLGLDPWVRNQ